MTAAKLQGSRVAGLLLQHKGRAINRIFSECLLDYFFTNSNTALVIPMMPTRIVGSGTGANLLECTLGSGVPVFLLSAIFAGSTAPMKKSQAGIEWSSRLYSEKSSVTITGSVFSTLSAPSLPHCDQPSGQVRIVIS